MLTAQPTTQKTHILPSTYKLTPKNQTLNKKSTVEITITKCLNQPVNVPPESSIRPLVVKIAKKIIPRKAFGKPMTAARPSFSTPEQSTIGLRLQLSSALGFLSILIRSVACHVIATSPNNPPMVNTNEYMRVVIRFFAVFILLAYHPTPTVCYGTTIRNMSNLL